MSGATKTYLVAGRHPWNRRVFEERLARLPGGWHYVGSREELSVEAVERLAPRYLFFLHWSWKVPDEIVERHECVAFHMTDLPYGRGGSPLQNLILRGQRATKLTAFRMTAEIDGGPVYLKRDLPLDGTAREIYERATETAATMIARITETKPEPTAQRGEVVRFRRRRPADSEIPGEIDSAERLYDFIRMLDCDGYPRAFVERGAFRFELRDARLEGGRLSARVTVVGRDERDADG